MKIQLLEEIENYKNKKNVKIEEKQPEKEETKEVEINENVQCWYQQNIDDEDKIFLLKVINDTYTKLETIEGSVSRVQNIFRLVREKYGGQPFVEFGPYLYQYHESHQTIYTSIYIITYKNMQYNFNFTKIKKEEKKIEKKIVSEPVCSQSSGLNYVDIKLFKALLLSTYKDSDAEALMREIFKKVYDFVAVLICDVEITYSLSSVTKFAKYDFDGKYYYFFLYKLKKNSVVYLNVTYNLS
jgi:hypothetical protein